MTYPAFFQWSSFRRRVAAAAGSKEAKEQVDYGHEEEQRKRDNVEEVYWLVPPLIIYPLKLRKFVIFTTTHCIHAHTDRIA